MADLVVDLRPRHARLDGDGEVLGVDRDHLVHARQVDADTALDREQVAFERRADAERDHRHSMAVGELDDLRDLVRALAEDDHLGRRSVDRRLVAAVLLAHRERSRAAIAEELLQRFDHRRRDRARREAGHQMGGQRCVHGGLLGRAATDRIVGTPPSRHADRPC